MEPSTMKPVQRDRYGIGNLFPRSNISIRARLTACFVVIVLSMIAGDLVAVWQFQRMVAPIRNLSDADQTSLAFVRVHLDVDTFRDTVAALGTSYDVHQFGTEADVFRKGFLADIEHAEQTLRVSREIAQDETISSGLETLRVTLPSQLDTAVELASAGDWTAVRLRLAQQLPDMIHLSSMLVERVDQQVLRERARAIVDTQQARRRLFLIVPVAGLLTLLAAAALGWYVTQTITVPLSQLKAGAEALARGNFQNKVEVSGDDELAVLGKAFNHAAQQVQELYDAARQSEGDLRDLIENVPAMVFIALPGPSNEFASRRWREYTGISAEDTSGSGWQNVAHPEDLARHMEKWRLCSATGQSFEDEVRFRGVADGEYRWFLVRAMPLRDETGKILKWYGVLTDIEDLKRAEALLAGEKRILELVAKGVQLPEILETLCQLVEDQASGVLASILLVEGNQLKHGGAPSLPKAYIEAIDGVLIGPCVGSCGTAAYLGQQVIVEDIAADPLWADFRDAALPHSLRACWSTPVFSSQGEVIATFAMYYREPRRPTQRDQQISEQITHLAGVAIERKLTYDQLQRSQAYLSEAQRLTHTGSFAYSPATRKTLYWSEELFRIFGFSPQSDIASGAFEVVHPEDRARVSESCLAGFREKANFSQDYRLMLRDGTLKHLHVMWRPVLDKDGGILEYVGTAADVTEQKRAEAERDRLRQREAELAHINRVSTMGELAASLAHEIKQPIAAALTNAEACLRTLEPDQPDLIDARDAASGMVGCVKRAAEIIDRVRSLFGTNAPRREIVDVNEVVRNIVVLLQDEARQHSISVHTQLADNLPRIKGDSVQLQQVVMNIMLNGIEAIGGAPGDLSIATKQTDDGQVLVSVSDTGTGFPAEQADKIFDAFFTTKAQGTGMGLAISRSIVESHGGRLWATINSGRGVTLHFTLPYEIPQRS